jgi:hypothetical protein
MTLKFSLAKLLLSVTVLAVVIVLCGAIPVHTLRMLPITTNARPTFYMELPVVRPPTTQEAALRFALCGPVSLAAMLAVGRVLRRVRRVGNAHENVPLG